MKQLLIIFAAFSFMSFQELVPLTEDGTEEIVDVQQILQKSIDIADFQPYLEKNKELGCGKILTIRRNEFVPANLNLMKFGEAVNILEPAEVFMLCRKGRFLELKELSIGNNSALVSFLYHDEKGVSVEIKFQKNDTEWEIAHADIVEL